MLFGYPPTATQNNWFHDCLIQAIRDVHSRVDAQQPYPRWPEILPAAHRATLKSRRGLRDRIQAYDVALRQLASQGERNLVLAAVTDQNRISELLSNTCNCTALSALPMAIQAAVISLFDFAFELLTDLSIRDGHYKIIYDTVPHHVCPFCGTEPFEAPGAPREAFDHYLAKSLYPFAAANLKNLVPMGHKCNSSYKLAADLLYDTTGTRRVAFDPYNHDKIDVVLDRSDPFNGSKPQKPNWQIDFEPYTSAALTWDTVFRIRERYKRDHLEADYEAWLEQFRKWALREGLRGDTDAELVGALTTFERLWSDGGMQDRSFLKAAVFRMLRLHCENGHQRLKEFLRDLLDSSTAAATCS